MDCLYLQDGNTVDVTPQYLGYTRDTLYELIGCEYIEAIRLPDDKYMVFDEEGKLKKGYVINEKATRLARDSGAIFPNDFIVGNALVCSVDHIK